MAKQKDATVDLPPLAAFVLDDHFNRGRQDRKQNHSPHPPLRPDSCAAYWDGYKHPTKRSRS